MIKRIYREDQGYFQKSRWEFHLEKRGLILSNVRLRVSLTLDYSLVCMSYRKTTIGKITFRVKDMLGLRGSKCA